MTHLEMLKTDLEYHVATRERLKSGKGVEYLKRPDGIVHNYDNIIRSLEEEIAQLEAKRAARKTKKSK